MAATNYRKCLAFVLKHEGGKVDLPSDPGGRTNQGITHKTYDNYRDSYGLPHRDVYLMTADERDAIYRHDYWDAIEGDKLRKGEDLVVFDFAVNSGPQRALRYWRDCGALKTPVENIIQDICHRRLSFLKGLKTWNQFSKGWSKRVTNCAVLASEMARTADVGQKAWGGAAVAGGLSVVSIVTWFQTHQGPLALTLIIVAIILAAVIIGATRPKKVLAEIVDVVPENVLSGESRLEYLLGEVHNLLAEIAIETEAVRAQIESNSKLITEAELLRPVIEHMVLHSSEGT